jgi:hypothetical protein
MATKAQLEAELAHVKRTNFYVTTVVMMIWAIGLAVLVTYEYKSAMLKEAQAEQYLNDSLNNWHTEVKPNYSWPDNPKLDNQDLFTWPKTPIIDARAFLESFSLPSWTTAAQAAHHRPTEDLPVQNFLYTTPLKLWTVQQQATPQDHVSCSATRTFDNGVQMIVTSYKSGAVEMRIEKVGFSMREEVPYLPAVISVDSAEFAPTTAKRVNEFTTTLDLSSMPLKQLASGKVLRVTVNGFYYEFELTGSANAAKYVAMCNSSGQSRVYERTVQAAAPAAVSAPVGEDQ